MRHQSDPASRENSRPWSGQIKKAGQDLMVRWTDVDQGEAGVMWVPMEQAAGLVSALLDYLPGGSGFVRDLMRQSLVGRIPDEHLEKAADCTAAGALLAIEHALALAEKARTPVKPARKWGTINVVPTGENEGML